jgi:uncharacterized protein YbjT (DUF2867 family)
MKVVVIGGTGRTGRRVAEVAAAQGHQVDIFGRSGPVPGDATNPADVDRGLAGADAAILCLSIPRAGPSPWAAVVGPPDLHSRSAELVCAALARHGGRRLIKVSAQGVGASAARTGIGFRWLVAASNLRPAFADHALADERVRASGLDWTVVHPPRLADDAATGRVEAGESVTTGTFTVLPRGDLARWVVDALVDPSWVGRTVSIGPLLSETSAGP